MSQPPVTIPKQPVLRPAEDYYRLRREGIGFIEQMGSQLWTDYNVHDPGITILEALCYALTDLAYRIGWDIKDLLTAATPPAAGQLPYPNQAFFTARDILTVNPTTPADFRRLLIDLAPVRNAWVVGKECACDLPYYAWCENDQLRLSYQKPLNTRLEPKQVAPLGLYEVLLELEADPELGDLNDRKIEHRYSVFGPDGKPHLVTLELRFPAWELTHYTQWQRFMASTDAFAGQNGASFTLKLLKLNRNKTDRTFLDTNTLRSNWRNVLCASFELELQPGGDKITIEHATLRLFGDSTAKSQTTTEHVQALLADPTPLGFVQRYRHKLLRVEQAVAEAQTALHAHRNLDEDYCRIRSVGVEEVAVCADVEVAPDADIERVQAQIWLEIATYFNPPVPFYTLPELLAEDTPVEDIFNGPALKNGFIKAAELEAAGLKSVLRTSDIINRLMDIEGVVAVNNLLLSKYDAEGNPVPGAADPIWHNGQPVFDATKASAAWLLFVSAQHQPRLYFNLSRFLFYKNGLPFLPRPDEAYDTLTQLRGEAERPKIKNAPNDLPAPAGTFRAPEQYFPVQYSLPQTYGVGAAGLPASASALRQAQAKQLKAYLLVFEQLLGNALAQVAHTADLFSLDPAVGQTYFVREFGEELIKGYAELTNGLTPPKLAALTESAAEFQERRNRFLDHLLARFGEQFNEYALLLTDLQGRQVGLTRLINDKISFLKAYPLLSHNRGKAFNYAQNPCAPGNRAGLKRRVSLLLGYPDLAFEWNITGAAPGPYTATSYQLTDAHGTLLLTGDLAVTGPSEAATELLAFREVVRQLIQLGAYAIAEEAGQLRLQLTDQHGHLLGQRPALFATLDEALAFREELLAWSSNERAIVVEHLLLQPKFPGDALYPACPDGACTTCGDEDPYSFRLTYVMPGWTAPFNVNLDMRRFADRTIQQETPAHLLSKVCWVGNDGFVENPCDEVVDQLAAVLGQRQVLATGLRPTEAEACACALTIYTAFSAAFRTWYADKALDYLQPEALAAQLKQEFTARVSAIEIACLASPDAALWGAVQELMIKHFQQIALYGWQFERFEAAWCAWLTANAAFNWPEERLHERVEALLQVNVTSAPPAKSRPGGLCVCATTILTEYGLAFYKWLEENMKAGRKFPDFPAFTPPAFTLCANFSFRPGTASAIAALLDERYGAYQEVSYRLWVLLHLLGELRNTYPGATLHDCDDGSDQNPVRLGSTALGNYPPQRSPAPAPLTDQPPGTAPAAPSPPAPKPGKPGRSRKPPRES